jgi:diguanylate cyclase (GGDEF)-like protein
MEKTDRDQYVELSKFNTLITSLAISMMATILNTIIITAVFWNISPRRILTAWCSANIIYALSRYSIIYYYKKHFNKAHLSAWKIGTFISFAIAGILFGSAGIFLMDPSRFEYAVFLYFLMGGMVVGSAGSYHNDLPIFFVYSSTVFMIPTAGLYFMNMGISSPMVALGIVFYSLVCIMAVRLSRDLRESLLLRYDNNQLVRSLEEEKIHTERLNAELVEKNRELNELSLVDPLTLLRNRRYLFEIVMPEIEAFGRNYQREKSGSNSRLSRKGFGVFIVDIDHFKQVNDKYGHDSGDLVLVQFAEKLKESVRSDDVVSRFGGEEFIVVLKNIDETNAADIAKKLHDHIQAVTFTVTGSRTLNLTCSIGFLFYPSQEYNDQVITFEKMISIADRALYYAKDHGRNTSVKAVLLDQKLDFIML